MSQWYYSNDGQQQGPVSDQQLKQLAATGVLKSNSFVWKQGMSQWAEARKLKGLFPVQTAATSSPPQSAAVRPVQSPTATAVATTLTSPPSSEAPALWNPKWLGAWSFFFTWAFGAFLLARNWKALGQPGRAKRAMLWFYTFFLFLLACLLLCGFAPDVADMVCRPVVGIAIFVAFVTIEVNPQIKLVKARFGEHYPRKSWWVPIGVVVGSLCTCIVGLVAVLAVVAAFFPDPETPDAEHPNIALVKIGYLKAYPNVTVGKAVDDFIATPKWKAIQGTDGKEYVNVEGGVQFRAKPIRVSIQFRVDRTSGSFEVNAVEFNDIPQSDLIKVALLTKMFESVGGTP